MNSSTKKDTYSSEKDSNNEERDILEEEFLKCEIGEFPTPKNLLEGLKDLKIFKRSKEQEESKEPDESTILKEFEKYDEYIIEVMRSGCNRQIAEYVISEYIKLEDKEEEEEEKEDEKKDNEKDISSGKKNQNKKYKKLLDLRDQYYDLKKKIIIPTREEIKGNLKNLNDVTEYIEKLTVKENIEDYEEEIEEVLKDIDNPEEKENMLFNAKIYLIYYIEKQKKTDKEEFKRIRKEYIDKRDAVIETCLRKVKKIVNDEKEYKIFYEKYYGKKEPED